MSPYQNFDEVEDDGFDLIPDDTYACKIVSVVSKTISQGEVWKLRLEIQDGPHKGSVIGDDFLWWGGGLKRTKACLSAMDFDLKGGKVYKPSDLIGMPVDCQVVTKTREAGGKTYTESKPTFKGYYRDMDKPWTPATVPSAKAPGQGTLDAADDQTVPF